MLTHLSIRDLVLIASVALEFGPGLNVLTGETGAGKSILLDGLGLLLGDRADAGLVRTGAREAQASASFEMEPDHPALLLLEEQGVTVDGPLLLRRIVRADGGSRAFVNDTPVSAGLLKTLGGLIVEVHGQHDDRGLLAPRGHLALLDAWGRLDTGRVRAAWARLEAAEARLQDLSERLDRDRAEADWLAHASAELNALDPKAGEEARLADMRRRMQDGARLAEALDQLDAQVSGADGILSLLRQVARRLERMGGDLPELAAALATTDRMLNEGDALEAALGRLRAETRTSPESLEAAEARLFELRALARKHRVTPEDLPTLREQLAERLEALGVGEAGLAEAERDVSAARVAHDAESRALHVARIAAAAAMDDAVARELPALRLEAARFRTAVEAAPAGPTGASRATFEVAMNPGSPFGPMARIASGGELSRLLLALKVVLAATGRAGTLVFDEIDRGVGGATASAIGSRLARVAAHTQLLVVTHSPQVAAAGRAHFRISKEGGATRVEGLEGADRTEEIARMLSGAEITAEARAQAARLLDAA